MIAPVIDAQNAYVHQLAPLQRLIVAYGKGMIRHRLALVFALDARLADLVRSTNEPMIGAIKMAWWREALGVVETARTRGAAGQGDPLVDAMTPVFNDAADRTALSALIAGWEALIDPADLDDVRLEEYATGRAGLFPLAAGRISPDWLGNAGAGWALWDMAGHVQHDRLAERAIQMAKQKLLSVPERGWPDALVPLRLLTGIARVDAVAEQIPTGGLTPALYRRLLWRALLRKG